MGREYQQTVESYHRDMADDFCAGTKGREVWVRITDRIYVYLYRGRRHIQTQCIDIPGSWMEGGLPSDETVRRYIHRNAQIGRAPITTLRA